MLLGQCIYMGRQVRKRQDPRREATGTALIEAAESLFAAFGVDGVSTRQLGAAIGSSNTNVVAYYFGSKEALVEAVYRHRLPDIDRRRGELLRAADEAGQADDLLVLMRAFALPLFEQTDAEGRHTYARFVAGIERSGMIATRAEVDADFPKTTEIVRRIVALISHQPAVAARAHIRIRLAIAMIVASLQIADQEHEGSASNARQIFETALRMATAGLTVPLTSPEID